MGYGRDVMADIISAKCFGCGHVVKVPSALGGKKARCPQCTNTIVIPTSADSNAELIPDEQLPEVARDEEVGRDGEVIEENAEVLEAEVVDEGDDEAEGGRHTRTRTRSRRGTGVRRKGETRKSGTRMQKAPSYTAVRKKSSAGLVVGIIIAVVAVAGIGVAVSMSGGAGPAQPSETAPDAATQAADQVAAADHDLEARCIDYTRAVNNQNISRIMDFYVSNEDNRKQVLRGVNRLVEQNTRYDDVTVKSASAASGQTTFSHASGEKTLQWEKVDGKWLISGTP